MNTAIKVGLIVATMLSSVAALAAEAPPDPDITIKLSELQAIINSAVADHEAAPALAKVQAQAAPKPAPVASPAPNSTASPK